MRNKRLFQLTSGPRGKYVYHRSPSGRKVTKSVPNSVMTKNDAVRYFAAPRLRSNVSLKKPLPHQALDCSSLRHLTGMKKIGSGRQGVIFAATRRPNYLVRDIAIKVSPFDKAAESRGETQPSQVEWDIQKVVQRVAQGGVLPVMQFVNCKDFVSIANMNNINKIGKKIDPHRQAVLFMERADGGPMSKWIVANAARLTDDSLLKIINKVLFTLHTIMKNYSEFRHNDLHLDNVLMKNGEPLIADFGWSRIKKTGTNPAVNTALANGTAAKYGIGPDTSSRYDMHLFMNEMRRYIRKMGKFPRTMAFFDRNIPEGYRGFSDEYTTEGRLKYGIKLPGLPSLREVLKDPEMKWNRGTPSPGRKPKPKSPSPVPKPTPKPKSPSPKKNFTNENFLAMSPRTFLKLSPKRRARAAAIRKAGKAMGTVYKTKPVNNATAKRMPSPRRLTAAGPRISPRILRSSKFNKFVVSFLNLNGSEPYQNRWNAARAKALNAVLKRMGEGKPAFSASPPAPKRPSPPVPAPVPKRSSPSGVVRSAGSGRLKVTGPSGRLVYVDGSTISMNFLRSLAARKGVNSAGIRTKEAIARAIFNRK